MSGSVPLSTISPARPHGQAQENQAFRAAFPQAYPAPARGSPLCPELMALLGLLQDNASAGPGPRRPRCLTAVAKARSQPCCRNLGSSHQPRGKSEVSGSPERRRLLCGSGAVSCYSPWGARRATRAGAGQKPGEQPEVSGAPWRPSGSERRLHLLLAKWSEG